MRHERNVRMIMQILYHWTSKTSMTILQDFLVNTIRIFNVCEVLIENSVTRVTIRHHEACRVMPNSYPSDGIFNSHRRTIMDSFSCILFLRQLHLDLNMCCFINFTLKQLHFSRKVWYGSSLIRWRRNVWRKLT